MVYGLTKAGLSMWVNVLNCSHVIGYNLSHIEQVSVFVWFNIASNQAASDSLIFTLKCYICKIQEN